MSHNHSERMCVIPWNVCRFKTKLWLWYIVLLWTTCVFDLHPCYTNASAITFYISEGLPKGSFVGRLSHIAFDRVIGISPRRDLTVDISTKTITTNIILDRETVENYNIVLLSVLTAVTHTVYVNVTDSNDNIPSFTQAVYNWKFDEGSAVKEKFKAVDKDFGSNSTQRYTILSGNVGDVFSLATFIDRTGALCADLVLAPGKELDRETRDWYILNVSASDGGNPPQRGFALLNITVRDRNDHKPVFKNSSYSADTVENSPVGTSILKVFATDNDIGTNGQVLYSIERGSHSDPQRIFSVDPNTGVVVNNVLLNYEDRRDYNIFVRAQNPGVFGLSMFAIVPVAIHVVDENDNKPDIRVQFALGGSYQVSEDAGIGTTVARIYVSDQDSGKNGQVDVTLEGGNGHFSAKSDPSNNVDIIALAKELDRETQPRYTLKVVAKDRGQPQQVSEDSFIINVGDVNDNYPKFDQAVFNAVLSENATIGTSVLVAHATDRDAGSNAKLTYNITYTSQAALYNTWFNIDPTSGEIRTAALLDRERVPRLLLNVTVMDSGVPPLSSSSSVFINISDTNDNDPMFSRDMYFATVPENTGNGTSVTQVSAKDIDSGANGLVQYSLEMHQRPAPFAIDPITGLVTTSGKIDHELHPSYMLKVVATDGGGRVARSDLNISVVDVNDNYPVISPTTYNVSVYENFTTGDPLTAVSATDDDSGLFSRLTFAIASGNGDGVFFINPATGIITLHKSLDRETRDFHEFEVEATDGGGLKSNNSAIVRVTVLDVNDEPPVFDPSFYNFAIIENSALQTVLGSVHASSKDLGTNADIYYSIKGGDVDNVFAINSTGTIFSQGTIDHEKSPRLLLTIQARDGGSPPLIGFANVSITVIDQNDNSPSFASSEIPVNILEDTQVGRVFYNVTADDADSGLFGQVRYTLLSNPNNTFKLDHHTGALSLTHAIDFEGPRQYTIQVLAEDGGSPPLNATATFRLTVVDVNDHTPKFPNSTYTVHVSEQTVGGTDILNVSATDADTGINARITYSFQPGVDTSLFGLKSNGWIYIKQGLNREQKEVYRFGVVATDQGNPPKSSTADVVVYVDDVNDNNPEFTSPSYFFPVSENESNRTFVGKVSATDRDAGSNAKIAYSFQSPSPQFVINKDTGVIRTNQVLDRETQSSYVLMVEARDHGENPRTDKTSITVTVQDLNDNNPAFRNLPYQKAVLENVPVGSFVLKVVADDPDYGSNGEISYYTASGHLGPDSSTAMFSVDAQSGEITTAARLDREKKDRYTLFIVARDHGSPEKDNVTTVTIHVLDVNDNPPRFVNNSFFVNVPEKLPVGTVVTTVTAKDSDAGNNGKVRYTIDQGNAGSVFQINESTGVIVLRKQLDFERKSKYQLRVVARDQGQNSQSSFLYVTVYVLDSNDNRPTFDKNPVTVSLREGVPINYNVTRIKARDGDSGQNSWIRYSIDSQSPGPPKFKVDPSTGLVQAIGKIDRESVDEYTLNIRATDQAFTESERLSSTITVFIIVEDVNDNKPDFVSPNYTFVMEDEPFGYPVITITAIDQDSGSNARVRYRIEQGNSGKFSLEPDTGLLKLHGGLDYETKPKYVLNISATDEGSSPLSSYQVLTIYLVDVNDNAPQFNQSLFLGQVSENEPVGIPVMPISAYDLDSGSNGALTYSIPRGAVKSKFAIDKNTGVISTNSTLDREEKDMYFLTVYATDRAFPFRVATCTVKITVLDKNDHAPTFNPARLNLTVWENRAPFVFHVLTAQDPDIGQNGRLRYSVRSGNEDGKFAIGEFSGELSTTAKLDREKKARYDLQIQASDITSPFHNSSAHVTIIVGDENDNPPKFLKVSYDVSIRELTRINSVILNVTATDGDLGMNGQVVYSLSNKTFGTFRIDSKTGLIYTLREFDFSVKHEYIFTCYATDRGVVPRQASAEVKVSISDENNHAPEFDQLPYRKAIQSSVSPGDLLVTVRAKDKDSEPITQMTYRLANSSRYFQLSSNSGELRIKQNVTTVPNGTYTLSVLADDGGNLTGRGIVEILVGQITSDPPKFVNSSPAFVSIPENSPKGYEVTRVLATRTGGSGVITYSIVDGNNGNAFFVHPQSGIVTVANQGQLDFERLRRFRVHIIASLQGLSSGNAYLRLNVNLTDVNDNKPVFYPANISVQLTEDDALLSSGFQAKTVAIVTTTDKDSGSNSKITYQLSTGNVHNKFRIDSKTGVITTQGHIDRENRTFYDLVVKATDHGSPPKSSLSHVLVSIIDVNDNVPAFAGPYTVDVDEDEKVGSVVKRIVAVDKDEDPNLVYSFSSGKNSQDAFHIDRFTGDITLLKSLDYEVTPSYVLHINVTDGTYQSQTILTVIVQDVNDNAPRFLNSSYQATLSEETAAGTSILRVSAEDKDSGSNGQLSYAFVTPVNEFRINATSGVFYTAQRIHVGLRESLLFVVVSATDHGFPAQRAFVTVQIRINRRPRFTEASYEASIPEDTEPGTSILTVKAVDDGSGINVAKIGYVIKHGDLQSLFRIGRRSGVIEVNKRGLDYEKVKNYLLGVEARDDSTNKSVVVRVNITITDVNDNQPVFNPKEYMEEVDEDVSIGTTLLRVTATDEDSGSNGRVLYSIVTGNDKLSFRIDSTSGDIVTVKNLDHESMTTHLLSVQARDQGLKPKSRFASVVIKVGDLNDNKPKFLILHPEDVAVKENSPVGTSFYKVSALDSDSGNNGAVKYSITGGSGEGLFLIDRFSGMLSTNATFDYETKWLYSLEITAVDSGSRPLSNKVNLTVYVKSVDENEPTFVKSSYSFGIPGNAEIGDVVGQVSATDEDGGEDGIVRYSLEFSSMDVFEINKTSGVIFVNRSLEEVASSKRSRRSVEVDEEHFRPRRVRRETDRVTLRIRADSGKPESKVGKVWAEVEIDFACPGCPTTGSRGGGDEGISGSALSLIIGLAVLVGIVLIAFIVVMVAIYTRKKKKRNHQNRRSRFDGSFDEITVHPPAPNGIINHVDSSLENVSTPRGYSQECSPLNGPSDSPARGTESSDTPNSASSGRGSSEGVDFEVDQPPVLVNGDLGSLHSENYIKTVVGPDSGIQQDSDQVSQLTISDGSSMMQGEGLAIDKQTDKIDRILARLGSQESLHVFGEEGGGEADGGVDVGNLLYAKLSEVDADEDESIIDGMRPFIDEGHDHPSYGGSLSSIVGSREELTGSYNWDYLLDWGPQFQPLADVFLEIGKMKDDNPPKKAMSLSLPSSRDSRNAPTGMVTTDMLSPVSSLPRSPISPPSTRYTSPAFSPNFTPAITPLITRSPSVSPLDTGTSSPIFSPAAATPKSGSRPSSMHVMHLRRDSHDGSNSDLTHSPSISDNESNLEIDV